MDWLRNFVESLGARRVGVTVDEYLARHAALVARDRHRLAEIQDGIRGIQEPGTRSQEPASTEPLPVRAGMLYLRAHRRRRA